MEERKFPVNKGVVAGKIAGNVIDNPEKHRIQFQVRVNKGKDENGNYRSDYIKCVVSGKERYYNFKKDFEQYLEKNPLEKEPQPVKDLPFVKLSGQAYFSKNKDEEKGVTHSNYALIVTGKLDKQSESYQMPQTKEEINNFIKENNGFNLESNKLEIRGNLFNAEVKQNKGGEDFAIATFSHSYIDARDNQKKPMYANIVVPASLLKETGSEVLSNPENGKSIPIFLTASVQPTQFKNADGQTVAGFQLVTKSLSLDLTKKMSIDKPVEIANDVSIQKEKETSKEQSTSKGKKSGAKVEKPSERAR